MVPAQLKYIILSILFVLAAVNFTRTAFEIIENSKRLDSLSQEVKSLEDEKSELKESVAYKKTNDFVEEKARNELNFIRSGEKVFVLSKSMNKDKLKESVMGINSISYSSNKQEKKSNFNLWVGLFIK